ncbi:MAG: metallophosphoesterase family protein [Syntrophales bacterium]
MKIGVISDTHLKGCDDSIRQTADRYFADAELILHAGDLVDIGVLDAFKGKEVIAVYGNMDSLHVKNVLPPKRVLEIKGFKVGLIHGWGPPFGLKEKLKKEFDRVDCLVFGHTHFPYNRQRGGILYFNPGSASNRVLFPGKRTVGLLEIDEFISGKIIEIH